MVGGSPSIDNLNQNPLFQVVFALQNAPMTALELPNLTLSPLPFETETTRFDLELHLWEPNTLVQHPDAIALVAKYRKLTYQELNILSNKLAYYMTKSGVKAEVLVGLCVERSIDLVVGILGILKAGGAYVPIDPTYPSERLNPLVQDANISVVLTRECWNKRFEDRDLRVICVDKDWESIDREPETNLDVKLD